MCSGAVVSVNGMYPPVAFVTSMKVAPAAAYWADRAGFKRCSNAGTDTVARFFCAGSFDEVEAEEDVRVGEADDGHSRACGSAQPGQELVQIRLNPGEGVRHAGNQDGGRGAAEDVVAADGHGDERDLPGVSAMNRSAAAA